VKIAKILRMLSISGILPILSLCATLWIAWVQYLKPARLRCYKPLVFSLDDEQTDPRHKRRPAIAVALTVHNAGALTGAVWDTMVAVTRSSGSGGWAAFQARKLAADLRFVTVSEIEEHARPIEPIVVRGRETRTVVVQYEQRSKGEWSWEPGEYAAAIYFLDANGSWKHSESFTFKLTDADVSQRSGHASVTPCQRRTHEALVSLDDFMDSLRQPKKRAAWSFQRKSDRG